MQYPKVFVNETIGQLVIKKTENAEFQYFPIDCNYENWRRRFDPLENDSPLANLLRDGGVDFPINIFAVAVDNGRNNATNQQVVAFAENSPKQDVGGAGEVGFYGKSNRFITSFTILRYKP